MQKKIIATLLLLATMGQSQAALTDAMNTMFGNVTAAGQFSTTDRTGFQGGGVAIRSPISPINIVAFDPPRIGAGCGGLNFYGGSFSLINKDQFVALLRKIAQNSLGLAFKMAVDVVNEKLGGAIDYIYKIIGDANNSLSNTCAVSSGLMNLATKSATSLLDSQVPEVAEGEAAAGKADDTMSTKILAGIKGVGQAVADSLSGSNSSNASSAGNPIWNMIVAQQAGDQLFSGGVNVGMSASANNQILLSMTGFVILNSSSYVQQYLGSGVPNKQIGYYPRTITINELREGWSGSSTVIAGKPEKTIYICNPDYSQDGANEPDCTAFVPSTDKYAGGLINKNGTTDIPFLGMQGFVNNALFGNPDGATPAPATTNATNVSGPVGKVTSANNAIDAMINGVPLTTTQQGVLMTTRLPVMPLIYVASGGLKDRAAAFEQAKILAPIIADEYTYAYADAVVTIISKFLTSNASKKNIPKEMYQTLEAWQKERDAAGIQTKTIVNRLIAADRFAHASVSYNPALGFTTKSTK